MKPRPSNLPMLAACPCFDSDGREETQYMEAGTSRHSHLNYYLRGVKPPAEIAVDDEEMEKVRWAAAYVRDHSPVSNFPLRIEEKRELLADDFTTIMEGTPDVTCGPILFDAKSRPRRYVEQMAAYALMMMQECPAFGAVNVHLMFMETQTSSQYILTLADARKVVFDVLSKAQSPDAKPEPCDYCNWCGKIISCPAYQERVEAIAAGREWKPATYHASEIDKPDEMGKILTLAKQVASWVKAVEHHAKVMAIEKGQIPTGFKIAERKGKTYVTNILTAFSRSGLPQEEFLKACSLRLESSKTFADQVGIIDLYKAFNGITKKAEAKRQVLEKLADALAQAKPSLSLRAINDETESAEKENL